MDILTGDEHATPELPTEFVQVLAVELVKVVEGIRNVLALCHARLPISPDQKAMLEDERPCDLATDLRGTIECLVNDCLNHAVRMLREMGELSEEAIRGRWRSRDAD